MRSCSRSRESADTHDAGRTSGMTSASCSHWSCSSSSCLSLSMRSFPRSVVSGDCIMMVKRRKPENQPGKIYSGRGTRQWQSPCKQRNKRKGSCGVFRSQSRRVHHAFATRPHHHRRRRPSQRPRIVQWLVVLVVHDNEQHRDQRVTLHTRDITSVTLRDARDQAPLQKRPQRVPLNAFLLVPFKVRSRPPTMLEAKLEEAALLKRLLDCGHLILK